MAILTDAQAAVLVKYLKDVQLSNEQQDRLIQKYWEADEEERREIARAYAYLFSTKAFVDRLIDHLDYYARQRTGQSHPHPTLLNDRDSSSNAINGSAPGSIGGIEEMESGVVDGGKGSSGEGGNGVRWTAEGSASHDLTFFGSSGMRSPEGHLLAGPTGTYRLNLSQSTAMAGSSSPTSPSSWGSSSSFGSPVTPRNPTAGGGSSTALSRRIGQTEMRLRTAITDQFSKLSGPGPFKISFGLVRSESERREVVDLFASQFEHPDPTEILRLVSMSQGCHTRSRRRVSGGYTWFIRSLNTGELVCAVHVMAHHVQTHHFVEMPLFATAAGYKNNGFGRLLNAALSAWCAEADFEFIMISADVNAIPFWEHLGYAPMSAKERKSIEFFYENECYKFKGATPMIGYCGGIAGVHGGGIKGYAAQVAREQFQNSLHRMTKFVVEGPLGFEE